MKMALLVMVLLVLPACGGAKNKGADSASDVTCPAGQTYDGQFCEVDQNVATAEVPVQNKADETSSSPLQLEPLLNQRKRRLKRQRRRSLS